MFTECTLSVHLMFTLCLQIFQKEDDLVPGGWQVDTILDKTGMKGTGKWTVQQVYRPLLHNIIRSSDLYEEPHVDQPHLR